LVLSSLRCFNTRKAFAQPPNKGLRNCCLSSYRLQPTSRFRPSTSPGWEPGHSLGFFPFQRYHHVTATNEVPTSNAPRSQVFATSQQVFGANTGLPVYSTQLALVGSGPSELYLRTIQNCLQSLGSFAVTCLPWFPSVFRFALPLATHHRGFPLPAITSENGP
jgi:hypothetical protein